MSQLRYNPTSRRDEFYYRIKESFRDLTGRVRSRIMLNVGFINEDHQPEDIRDIGKCLTYLHEHQGESNLFDIYNTPRFSDRHNYGGMTRNRYICKKEENQNGKTI